MSWPRRSSGDVRRLKYRGLVFAKYPEPGRVKTRLVPPLTAEQAAALHLACLRAVCERLAELRELALTLVVTPDERCGDLCRSVGLRPDDGWGQGDGDLGVRLERAVRRAFEAGAKGVLLFGADSPTLPQSCIRRAIETLHDYDGAIGPCDDGGYYLLAMRRCCSELFEGIEWGGPQVAERTAARARPAGFSLVELPVWYDLDRIADVRRAAADLRRMNEAAGPATLELQRMLENLVLAAADKDG